MSRVSLLAAGLLALAGASSIAGPWREPLAPPRAAWPATEPAAAAQVIRDIVYGDDRLQRFDVYLPRRAAGPVIFMVHGGGWRHGDKAARDVVENKAVHWLAQDFVFISVNNRLLPTDPLEQAKDVARALALAQQKAASWGADPRRFILMGHSAGAHLVALLSASPALARQAGAGEWLGTVALDSAALDVVAVMQRPHARLYDAAFGGDAAYWRAASPLHMLAPGGPPLLAVCSSRRALACPAAQRFADKAKTMGMRATVLEQDLSHGQVNEQLGLPGPYTDAVDRWIRAIL